MLKIIFCDDNTQFLTLLKSIVEDACLKQIPNEKDYEIGPAMGSGKEAIRQKFFPSFQSSTINFYRGQSHTKKNGRISPAVK